MARRSVFVLSLTLALSAAALAAWGWSPLPTSDDPLVRLPGSQPADGIVLEAPDRCLNCHDAYDPSVDIGFHWRGGMMAQAGRDPLFWATMTVAAQDSIWAVGRPNAADLCLRCHSPSGWLAGRSDPPNGAALRADDFDGVTCDACHRAHDPFFEDTYAGTREGADWVGYWDETGASATPSGAAAAATLAADRTEAARARYFNGTAWYGADHRPRSTGWTDNGAGQLFVAAATDERASFADDEARHARLYSRYHKSRSFCGTCHDVSNPVLANLALAAAAPGDGTTVLPSEAQAAHAYYHVERTFSEFRLSAFGTGAGAPGTGAFAPPSFATSRPGGAIATCQDCHMPDRVGAGCDKAGAPIRPHDSVEHPQSGQPLHDQTGGNVLVPWLLASTVPGSPNYSPLNQALLGAGAAAITMDLAAGIPLDADALLDASGRATAQLQAAATVEGLAYAPATGALSFTVLNHGGHKLPTGYPEGRRAFLNVRVWDAGALVHEVNPYDPVAGTLAGFPGARPLAAGEAHRDDLIYEARLRSGLTGEEHTFHFALADGRQKDNRIPPRGFRIAEAAARMSEPVVDGVAAPGLYSTAEYAGGYDQVSLAVPAGADGVEVRLYYQTTSREYVEFLRDEINGAATSLSSPTPSGEPEAYVAHTDPFFDRLAAWGDTIWQLWDANRSAPGAAPVLMASAATGTIGDPCAAAGSDGLPCEDGSACSLGDACAGGFCVPGAPVTCADDGNPCTAEACSPATGLCEASVLEGAPCDDADACSVGSTCQLDASCGGGAPVTCDDGDPCTLDSCDALLGCRAEPQPGCGVDAAPADAAPADAAPVDAAPPDAGAPDAGAPDAAAADATAIDAAASTPDAPPPIDAAGATDGPTPAIDGSAPAGDAASLADGGAHPGDAAPPGDAAHPCDAARSDGRPAPGDAGLPGGDAADASPAGPDAPPAGGDEGGCGCRAGGLAPGGLRSSALLLALALVLRAVGARRRRR